MTLNQIDWKLFPEYQRGFTSSSLWYLIVILVTIKMSNSKEVPCPFDPDVVNRVKYLCSCGLPQPLSKLYFCRHCLDLRCGFCVLHEVDSHYCPNCLENMPSAEARLKKNRCANCFDCPSCGHTLSTRASSMPIKAPTEDGKDIKTVTKKLYYLACAFCRWTSRDAGLQDQVWQFFVQFV